MSRSRSRNRRGGGRTTPGTTTTTAPAAAGKQDDTGYHIKHIGTMALWIATPFGVLMPGTRPPHTYDTEADDRSLQVRTRDKDYIDRFRELYCPELGEANHFPGHDYPWKAYVSPEKLALAVARMVLDTDSEVFKPLAEGPKGLKDKTKARRLHDNYGSWWSSHLTCSDGTSSWDGTGASGKGTGGNWKSTGALSGSLPLKESKTVRAKRCEEWGHWFSTDSSRCWDCSTLKPAGWKLGDNPIYPKKKSSVLAPKNVRVVEEEGSGVVTPVFPPGITPDNLPTVSYGMGEPHVDQPLVPLGYGSPADEAEFGGDGHGWTDPGENDDLYGALVAAQEQEERFARDGGHGVEAEVIEEDDYGVEPEIIDSEEDDYDPASARRCPECSLGNGMHRTFCSHRFDNVRRIVS